MIVNRQLQTELATKMSLTETLLSIILIIQICYFGIVPVQCVAYNWQWAGPVTLKSSLDNNLCARTETIKDEKVFLKLVDCNLVYPYEFTGTKIFELEIVDDKYRILRTRLKNGTEKGILVSPEEGCFYSGYGDGSLVLTDSCDRNNPLLPWEFKKLSANKVQWIHKQTGRCVTVPMVKNGKALKTAKCNVSDGKQIWEAEFSEYGSRWDDARRRVTFKLAADESLCITTDQFDQKHSTMNLWPCTKVYNKPYTGGKEFGLGKISGGSFEIRTTHLPTDSENWEYGCFYTGYVNNSPDNVHIFTKRCNYNDQLQYFKFIETSANLIQLYHNYNEKCIRASKDRKTVVTVHCDTNDVNQIWIPVFRNA